MSRCVAFMLGNSAPVTLGTNRINVITRVKMVSTLLLSG